MKLPSRSPRSGLHLLVAVSLVALSAGAGGLAFTSAAGAAPSSGTIKIGDETGNSPHQPCDVPVELFNFGTTPETHTATVVFTAQSPSGSGPVPSTPDHDGSPSALTFTGLPGNQLEKSVVYSLDTSGLTLTSQGFHVKVDVTVDGVVSKSKVFWVPSCTAPQPPVLSGSVVKTVDADGDGTYSAVETAPVAGAPVAFRALVMNTSSVEVTVGALTDSYGSVVIDPVVCTDLPPATLAAGASFTCDFQIAGYGPAVGGSVVNTFTAVLSKVGSTPVTISDTATTNGPAAPTAAPDLSLIKAAPATRTTGQTGGYTLTVQNVGTAVATSPITVTDTLPAGVTVTPTTSAGFDCTVAGQTVTCTTDDDLAVGATRTIVLPATFTTAGSMLNTATVSVQGDSNPANNTSTATTTVTAPYVPPYVPPVLPQSDPPDLAVQKTGPASVTPDSTVTWTLTVLNKGPSSASAFTVTDTLPAGVDLVSVSGSGFTCTAATVACTYTGVLAPGASATVTVVGSVPADIPGTSVTNVVVVTPTDVTPADNTDTLVSTIQRPTGPADLVLAKSGPSFAVLPGDVITWRIDVTNAGSSSATGFTVTDPLAAGLTLMGVVGDGFTCTTGTVECTYDGTLAGGETAVLLVSAVLDSTYTASSVINTATVPLAGDPTPENNTDSAIVGVNRPIGGGDTDPGEGEVPVPSPSPSTPVSPSPSPLPSTLPFADDEALPGTLPFTGSRVDALAGVGAVLGLVGMLLVLGGHRRQPVR